MVGIIMCNFINLQSNSSIFTIRVSIKVYHSIYSKIYIQTYLLGGLCTTVIKMYVNM